jgi:hypothetical protein
MTRRLLISIVVLGLGAITARTLTGQAPAAAPPAGQTRAGGPPAPPPPSPESLARAADILAATRQALGGERLAAIKSLTATGRTRRVRGNNLVPIEFQFDLERPDKFARRDESPAEETDPTSTGFNGDELIQFPLAAPGPQRAGAPPPNEAQLEAQRRNRVNALKQEFVRMALGLFGDTFITYPLTFSFVAQAEAPQGRADVLNVAGQGLTLRFFIDSQTRLPIPGRPHRQRSHPAPSSSPVHPRLPPRRPRSSATPTPRKSRDCGRRHKRHRSRTGSTTPIIATSRA